MNTKPLTTSAWELIADGKSVLMVQAMGKDIVIHIGATQPALDATSFDLPSGIPIDVPNVSALGGKVWAKGTGSIRYASA